MPARRDGPGAPFPGRLTHDILDTMVGEPVHRQPRVTMSPDSAFPVSTPSSAGAGSNGMAARASGLNPEVREMVIDQLRRDPPPPLAALYGRALRLDPSIRRLSPREFNALYATPVRRRMQRVRRRARDRAERAASRSSAPRRSPAGSGEPGSATTTPAARRAPASASASGRYRTEARLRALLYEWALRVARVGTRLELIEAVEEMESVVRAIGEICREDEGADSGPG